MERYYDSLELVRLHKLWRIEREKAKEIAESFSKLTTTVEEGGKGNMNEENDTAGSEINDMLLDPKTVEERNQLFFEDCAKTGLAQYNAQNGTDFELDKISGENHEEVYVHLNFIANSNNEKKCRMFFAEAVGFEERVVTACCILDPVRGMVSGCRFCGHGIYHPR